jgi:hypothetical protein
MAEHQDRVMLKPFALRLTRLLSAGLDLCLRFRQALYSEPQNDWAAFPPTSSGPLVGLVNNADAHKGHAKLNSRLRNPGRVCD